MRSLFEALPEIAALLTIANYLAKFAKWAHGKGWVGTAKTAHYLSVAAVSTSVVTLTVEVIRANQADR